MSGICRGRASNPHAPCGARDFKSLVSTNSTTPALRITILASASATVKDALRCHDTRRATPPPCWRLALAVRGVYQRHTHAILRMSESEQLFKKARDTILVDRGGEVLDLGLNRRVRVAHRDTDSHRL